MSSKDEVILSFHDSIIRRSDLNLLDGPYWLNDHLVGFFLQYLEKVVYKSRDTDVVFVSPEVTHCIKMSDEAVVTMLIEPLHLERKAYIFFPVNNCIEEESPGGSHWSLLMYARHTNCFYHLDSNGSSNMPHGRNIANKVAPHLHEPSPDKVTELPCQQQDNSYDCGIHLICNVEMLCQRYLTDEEVSLNGPETAKHINGKRAALKNLILFLNDQEKESLK